MALTDPELDLLREMLVDSPSDDVFFEVGEELVRRLRWAEAEQVLVDGLADVASGDPRRPVALALLARASLETGRYDLTASALGEVDTDPVRSTENARVEMLWLERSGQVDAARARARRFLEVDPADVVAASVLERLDLPPPDPRLRGADPLYTVDRAERYVAIQRPDRAIRVLRRILMDMARPEVAAQIEQRIRQLQADQGGAYDDLSEELTDPGLVPEAPDPAMEDVFPPIVPRIAIPTPTLDAPAAPAEAPSAAAELADYDDDHQHTTEEAIPADDEETDLRVAVSSTAPTAVPAAVAEHVRDRRKRRSLLRR